MSSEHNPLLRSPQRGPLSPRGKYQTFKGSSRGLTYSPPDNKDDDGFESSHTNAFPPPIAPSHSSWDVLPYYLPCLIWIPNYNWKKFGCDFIAGLSLASFQIPLGLSFATSLAHVEPLCGLYSLAVTPFIYALFGSVPHMIVGPESAISLVVGQAVETLTSHDLSLETVDIATMISFMSGLTLLFGGIFRLGFLGNILSKALLRGFISSIGFVMIVNSLITELKLNKLMLTIPEHYHTPFEKILFLVRYGPSNYHLPTSFLSLAVFTTLMTIRIFKKKMMRRIKWIVFIPEILSVVIFSIVLSYMCDLKKKYDISVIGDFNTDGFDDFRNPLSKCNRGLIPALRDVSLVSALLGFLESITASKSLGGYGNTVASSNRELVALGLMNTIGSAFGIIPAFGGYGRSKINAFSGAQTVMAGVFMGSVTLFTIKFLLPVIHYIPTCVLSVITTFVGVSLLEEAPHDIKFHIRCKGYDELIMFVLTFLCTCFYSIEFGILAGCTYSLISIVKHSAQSRIQILARVEGTDHFINANEYLQLDLDSDNCSAPDIEHFEGCLVVKIPEPLTFTNTEDLKERLDRLERFGSTKAHPGMKSEGGSSIEYIIFDLHGMTFMDSSATQILKDIVVEYRKRDVVVFLARVPPNLEVRERLKESGINDLVQKQEVKQHSNHSLQSAQTPYFPNIAEALSMVDNLKARTRSQQILRTSPSISSSMLMNSNLV
ncbi:uncharacterized protein KNAG_0D02390 [Huiozyma naganishii CBS 8797]|uniref:STAS domain-containing protein n=1 Tax=Huiozyma naganishii (strain ATCC MYA-139 / BCRC 22969 / CBS 8797 / KCTC 17520 / NBRC 10181 / NCYC 3082 / Yp74L-3) TaxID=1071383 RepID=J7S5T2_HUIN7|nr:hypothetical protein KNAG_0D02390 [Kazachstania naganishii CBS 8797]CCK69989.1 hypothetical protein KNAG_0D02390 [Kazachstania naganishii CBS 8797]